MHKVKFSAVQNIIKKSATQRKLVKNLLTFLNFHPKIMSNEKSFNKKDQMCLLCVDMEHCL